MAGRNNYTSREEQNMWDFLVREAKANNELVSKARGNEIWRTAADQGVTKHSFQSMRDRFRRSMYPVLKHAPLSMADIALLASEWGIQLGADSNESSIRNVSTTRTTPLMKKPKKKPKLTYAENDPPTTSKTAKRRSKDFKFDLEASLAKPKKSKTLAAKSFKSLPKVTIQEDESEFEPGPSSFVDFDSDAGRSVLFDARITNLLPLEDDEREQFVSELKCLVSLQRNSTVNCDEFMEILDSNQDINSNQLEKILGDLEDAELERLENEAKLSLEI